MDLSVPTLALAGVAGGFAIFSVAIAPRPGPKRWNRAKLDAYECGIEPTPQPVGGGRFPLKYMVTAMLFIVFDIEIIFLYPWAVSFAPLTNDAGQVIVSGLGVFALVEMLDRKSVV